MVVWIGLGSLVVHIRLLVLIRLRPRLNHWPSKASKEPSP